MRRTCGGVVAGDNKSNHRSKYKRCPHPYKKPAAKDDVFQIFAEEVRDHEYMESRCAVLQETKVEYFRGKDFVSLLRYHPEVVLKVSAALHEYSDKNFESAEDIANILLEKEIIVRCDRVIKAVDRPTGKSTTRLSAWPAHLEISSDQVFSDDDEAFFVWLFVKRRPLWQRLLHVFWLWFTVSIWFGSVHSRQAKENILDNFLVVLIRILFLLLFRGLVFGVLWIILGKHVWFFPNILDEEATLEESFQFFPKFKDEEAERPKWTSRLFRAFVVIFVIVLIIRDYDPHITVTARYQEHVLHPT